MDALTRIGWALFSGAVAASFVTALSIAIAAPRVWPEAQHPPEPCAYVCGDCNGTGVHCDRDGCEDGLIHDNGWDEE